MTSIEEKGVYDMSKYDDDQLSTFVALAGEPITLLTEVFPQQSWQEPLSKGMREQPTLKLRVSSDYHSWEMYFGNFETALAVASAIQDMVDDGLEAVRQHSNLTPRVRSKVVEPPTTEKQPLECTF